MADIIGKTLEQLTTSELEVYLVARKQAEADKLTSVKKDFFDKVSAHTSALVKTMGLAFMPLDLRPRTELGITVYDVFIPVAKKAGKKAANVSTTGHTAKPDGGKATVSKIAAALFGAESAYSIVVGEIEYPSSAEKAPAHNACVALKIDAWDINQKSSGSGETLIAYANAHPGTIKLNSGITEIVLEQAAKDWIEAHKPAPVLAPAIPLATS